jgi:predicted Zn-dependent protease
LTGCAINPVTGQEELMFFGPDDDVRLGQRYAPEIEQELGGRIPDEHLQSYVDRVGQRIARVSHRPDIAYSFTAVDEESINAFAVPGGYIFVTRGLLENLTSEAQLAAILGHEAGHVIARDTMVALSRQIGMTALLGAVLASDAPAEAVGGANFVLGVLSLQYSRDDEKDADFVGLSYLVQAGYDPNAIVETMEMLEELQTMRPIEFFSTHPNPESRVAYLKQRIADRYNALGVMKTGKAEYEQNVLAALEQRPRAPRPGRATSVP